jgi:Ferritin-like domain
MQSPNQLTSRDSNETSAMDKYLSSGTAIFPPPRQLARRSFIRSLGIGAALLVPGAGLLGATRQAFDATDVGNAPSTVTQGDIAILRFLAAAELLEQDLWQQYIELAEGNDPFKNALAVLDEDMNQYIADNTDDELSHANFINAALVSVGGQPVNLDAFRTLPSSQATGAEQIGRLTSLMNLTVDTSWWIRYRSTGNPDFADAFPQFIDIVNRPSIPLQDLPDGSDEIQAIANTAAFHFATIEQGGTSLYSALAPKATDLTVLKILLGIGGAEVVHFAIWHDKAGNAPEVSVPGVSFPDMKDFEGDELRQKNLIMPEPCKFISAGLPLCSVIRPSSLQRAGAVAAITGLRQSGLFSGQSQAFFRVLIELARAADAAFRS